MTTMEKTIKKTEHLWEKCKKRKGKERRRGDKENDDELTLLSAVLPINYRITTNKSRNIYRTTLFSILESDI